MARSSVDTEFIYTISCLLLYAVLNLPQILRTRLTFCLCPPKLSHSGRGTVAWHQTPASWPSSAFSASSLSLCWWLPLSNVSQHPGPTLRGWKMCPWWVASDISQKYIFSNFEPFQHNLFPNWVHGIFWYNQKRLFICFWAMPVELVSCLIQWN